MIKLSTFHKQLLKNEKGFVFPLIAWIAIMLVTAISTTVSLHMNNMEITKQNFEQAKIETILQMGTEELTEYISETPDRAAGELKLDYPYGNVIVRFQTESSNHISAIFWIETTNGSVSKKIKHVLLKNES
ncbi:hypothetical protein [Sediminibacillus albus]|uniref:Competence protein ComGG n=1 Tax=Sediminibacillus albus TaxID=407036 RepID=A0A1G9CTN8_9BACI|nr:hypothetical protein [Sediminibacillus albus]SDK55060.1 hypothetical protein SAMN05216243_3537 [Sediminibacillus albus]